MSSSQQWLERPQITVRIEPRGETVHPDNRTVIIRLSRGGRRVRMEASEGRDGLRFQVRAQDLERLARTLTRAVARAKRVGIVPTPERDITVEDQ